MNDTMNDIVLTEEQFEKLHKAVQMARLSYLGVYVEGGEPACIVGCLAHLEGVTPEQLRVWDGDYSGIDSVIEKGLPGVEKLQGYPLWLLRRMQRVWDSFPADVARAKCSDALLFCRRQQEGK